jgi:adenylate cyclase
LNSFDKKIIRENKHFMAIEIERKYLVKGTEWKGLAEPMPYVQGYLLADEKRTVRIRVVENSGFLTIKGKSKGMSRKEFEYEIPLEDARELLLISINTIIEKKRSRIEWKGKIWEVDEFEGKNKGLILAEIELKSEDEIFAIPPWIGEEVTGDIHYYNSYLSQNPYNEW